MKNNYYIITTLDLDMTLEYIRSQGQIGDINDFIKDKKPVHQLYEDENIRLYIEKKKTSVTSEIQDNIVKNVKSREYDNSRT